MLKRITAPLKRVVFLSLSSTFRLFLREWIDWTIVVALCPTAQDKSSLFFLLFALSISMNSASIKKKVLFTGRKKKTKTRTSCQKHPRRDRVACGGKVFLMVEAVLFKVSWPSYIRLLLENTRAFRSLIHKRVQMLQLLAGQSLILAVKRVNTYKI